MLLPTWDIGYHTLVPLHGVSVTHLKSPKRGTLWAMMDKGASQGKNIVGTGIRMKTMDKNILYCFFLKITIQFLTKKYVIHMTTIGGVWHKIDFLQNYWG